MKGEGEKGRRGEGEKGRRGEREKGRRGEGVMGISEIEKMTNGQKHQRCVIFVDKMNIENQRRIYKRLLKQNRHMRRR